MISQYVRSVFNNFDKIMKKLSYFEMPNKYDISDKYVMTYDQNWAKYMDFNYKIQIQSLDKSTITL
jgi:hypothetical protein